MTENDALEKWYQESKILRETREAKNPELFDLEYFSAERSLAWQNAGRTWKMFREQETELKRVTDELEMAKYQRDGLREVVAHLVAGFQWQPIETAQLKNHAKMMRPHVMHGPMSVVYYADALSDYRWFSSGMTTAWPEEAFEPLWMPLPLASASGAQK